MDVPCRACSSNPSGFAGHADLVVQTVGDGCISLRCRRCESFWSRTLQREGYFTWAALTARMASSPQMGVSVPPLSSASTYRPLPWRGGGKSPWLAALTEPDPIPPVLS